MAVPAAPIAPPEGKTGVAIFPIRNESGAPELAATGIDRILRDLFVQILTDSPELYVIHPQRIDGIAMRLGRPLGEATVDHDFARTIADSARAGAVLTGTLSKVGSAFVLNATLSGIDDDIVLDTFRAQARTPETLILPAAYASRCPARATRRGAEARSCRDDPSTPTPTTSAAKIFRWKGSGTPPYPSF
jgi:hypothetical protein